MGWEAGGRFKRERTYVYLWLIHVDGWQKPAQYHKAIILQLKIDKFFFFFFKRTVVGSRKNGLGNEERR